MKINKMLLVKYHDRLVGALAAMENGKIAFEYADDWNGVDLGKEEKQ